MFTVADAKKFLRCTADIMAANAEWLIKLDSVAGDSDLGLTMPDGFGAAAATAEASAETDIGKLIYQAGKAMGTKVPSTMGTLMASGLMNVGKVMKGNTELDGAKEGQLFMAYFDGVQKLGKAKVGEKTFLDGLYPAADLLAKETPAEGVSAELAQKAADAAAEAFEAAKDLVAVHGRMAFRGEASRGMYDPGAGVAMLLVKAYAESKKA